MEIILRDYKKCFFYDRSIDLRKLSEEVFSNEEANLDSNRYFLLRQAFIKDPNGRI